MKKVAKLVLVLGIFFMCASLSWSATISGNVTCSECSAGDTIFVYAQTESGDVSCYTQVQAVGGETVTPYSIDNESLVAGMVVRVGAWWDVDDDGEPSLGDYLGEYKANYIEVPEVEKTDVDIELRGPWLTVETLINFVPLAVGDEKLKDGDRISADTAYNQAATLYVNDPNSNLMLAATTLTYHLDDNIDSGLQDLIDGFGDDFPDTILGGEPTVTDCQDGITDHVIPYINEAINLLQIAETDQNFTRIVTGGMRAGWEGREQEYVISCFIPDVANGSFEIRENPYELDWSGYYTTTETNPEPVPMYMVFHYIYSPEILMKFPLTDNEQWTDEVSAGEFKGWEGTTTVISKEETVEIPDVGTFSNCLQLQTVITGTGHDEDTEELATDEQNKFVCGTRQMYFAPGVGLVKVIYNHNDTTTTNIELQSYSVIGSGDDYFPLSLGNTWTYQWDNGYRESVTETCTVTDYDEDELEDNEWDYADSLTFEGGLHLVKGLLLMLTSYELDVDYAVVSGGDFNLQDYLDSNLIFLTLKDEADTRLLARAECETAFNLFIGAFDSINAETDDQSNDFVNFIGYDEQDTARIVKMLGDIKDSLSLNCPVTLSAEDYPYLPEPITLDLSALFTDPIHRYNLPQFDDNNRIIIDSWTFPDPTFNGLFPDMTNAKLNNWIDEGFFHIFVDLNNQEPVEPPDGTRGNPFPTIQEAIDWAEDSRMGKIVICVAEGVYYENVYINRDITLEGGYTSDGWTRDIADNVTTINGGEGNNALGLQDGTDAVVSGFVITGGYYNVVNIDGASGTIRNCLIIGTSTYEASDGIACLTGANATIENCTIVDNSGSGVDVRGSSTATIKNCIITNNTEGISKAEDSTVTVSYSDVWENSALETNYHGMDDPTGEDGNISEDPLFIGEHDYHLQCNSPCIDSGDTTYDYSNEPEPNGRIMNMGAYGNTTRAKANDCDEDGMPDWWEQQIIDANTEDEITEIAHVISVDDFDGDELNNLGEYSNNTDPNDSDSDNDGMPDGWEVDYEFNPLVNGAIGNPDEDNFTNLEECIIETDPTNSGDPEGPLDVGDVPDTYLRDITGGTTQSAYVMISFPMTTDVEDPFADLLGPYDDTLWRAFRWNPDLRNYQEYPFTGDEIIPGKGYWLISRDNVTINVTGELAQTDSSYRIPLAPGWNQVGTPFNFQIDWYTVLVTDNENIYYASENNGLISPTLYKYENGGYGASSVMEPGEGYWINNVTDGEVFLVVIPIPYTPEVEYKGLLEATLTLFAKLSGEETPPSPPGGMDPEPEDNGSGGGTSGCFIATACFGSPMAGEVSILRNFRDTYLLSNPVGQLFVSTYYRYSPKVADFIAKHDFLKVAVRTTLYPVVKVCPHTNCF